MAALDDFGVVVGLVWSEVWTLKLKLPPVELPLLPTVEAHKKSW